MYYFSFHTQKTMCSAFLRKKEMSSATKSHPGWLQKPLRKPLLLKDRPQLRWVMRSAQLALLWCAKCVSLVWVLPKDFLLVWKRGPQHPKIEVSFTNTLPPHLTRVEVKVVNAEESPGHSLLCYHLFPSWPGVFHSHWMYRRGRFHRIWHNDPLLKPEWVLVSGSFQDPPRSSTSLHSWNVWDMVLLRREEK